MALCCLAAIGCQRSLPAEYVASAMTSELDTEHRALVRKALLKQAGTPLRPKMVGDEKFNPRRLKQGAAIYEKRCAQCHGTSGDGNGPAAAYLNPKPRDYRRGIFKFTATGYGNKPLRKDLVRTIRRGVVGTSMPAFNLLPDDELQPLVDYVLALTHRGELEVLLTAEAESADELPDDLLADLTTGVIDPWKQAPDQEIDALSAEPKFNMESVAAGRQAFLTKGCSKCHGDDGRGQTRENVGTDVWGQNTSAADLTSGMLHGGTQPIDIYRRIYGGINGTPMPAFKDALMAEPETIWRLVHYVQHVSRGRQRGETVYSPPGQAPSQAPTGETPSEATAPAAEGDAAAAEAAPAETLPAETAPPTTESPPAEGPAETPPPADTPAEAAAQEPATP